MKLLFASDSFKGSLSSRETADILEKAATSVFGDSISCDHILIADGGEGTLDAILDGTNGERLYTIARDPLFRKIKTSYGKTDDTHAIIEMASVSGLPLLSDDEKNPLHTTSFGTGELIKDALAQGFRHITIAIGGSASNDGGTGCAQALGIRFLDQNGKELQGIGKNLAHIASIDLSGLDSRLLESTITIMSDVTNPLCGRHGATLVFSEQKGATKEIKEELEKGMENYRDIIKKELGIDCDKIKGAGAAGGLGAALTCFLGGQMRSGIETLLELIDFDKRLEKTDLVITGEGQTDDQSCFGKAMQGIGIRAAKKGIPVIGLSGSLGKNATDIFDYGIHSLMSTVNAPMTLDYAMKHAKTLYYDAAVRMFRLIAVGMKLGAVDN